MSYFKGIFISDQEDLPQELANLFSCMTADNQARFFNALRDYANAWTHHPCFQWREMQYFISSEARDMLKDMYEHTDKAEP